MHEPLVFAMSRTMFYIRCWPLAFSANLLELAKTYSFTVLVVRWLLVTGNVYDS